MSDTDDWMTIPAGMELELLVQAREKAVTLLNKLLAEQADVEWDPVKTRDNPQAAADWRQAMICAIESAKRAVAAIDAAIKVAPGAESSGPVQQDPHRWN